MVSPMNEPAEDLRAAPAVEYLVEQFYPEEIAHYNDEADERLRAVSLWIREHPWQAIGVAMGAGLVMALAARPVIRLAGDAIRGMCAGSAEGEKDNEEGN